MNPRRTCESAGDRPRPSIPDPKIGELAGRRQDPAAQRSRVRLRGRSGRRRFEGDFVAECLELADVVALAAFGVDAGVVEVAAQVGEAGLRV
jgi:hypothetical protein